MKAINEHIGQHSTIQMVELKNKSFCIVTKRTGEIKQSFFNKYEKKEAIEFFELLKNINY